MRLSILFALAGVFISYSAGAKAEATTGSGVIVTLPDSSTYRGELRAGLFSGRGTLTWPNGAQYDGQFEHGLFHGYGKMTDASGDRLEGQYRNGMLNGPGKLDTTGGDHYEGNFVNDQLFGQGEYRFRNGDRYVGEFAQNSATGQGLRIYANGSVYNGNVLNWRYHGRGMLVIHQGAYYEGELREGEFHGTGEFTDQNGLRYIGEFQQGNLHGQGVIHFASDAIYSGDVVNWQAEGRGVMITGNGAWYVGEFSNNRFNGHGSYYYPSGDVHVGQFENGLFHGDGQRHYFAPRGRKPTLVGRWDQGRYVDEDAERVIDSAKPRSAAIDTEWVLHNQHQQLSNHLSQLRPSSPGEVDMYFLSFGSYAEQDVFMKEVIYTEKLFRDQFSGEGRTVSLINNNTTSESYPLASETNLRLALDALAAKMNKDEDILFMYLTSHGSRENGLSVSFGDAPFRDLSPATLDRLLDAAGIKWRIIVVSACYSGEFIGQLQDPETLVMTSSRADLVSFGCDDDADFTFFGRALFANSLTTSTVDFKDAFHQAKALITQWEKDENYDHSDPQLFVGERIESQLLEWRRTNQLPSTKRVTLRHGEGETSTTR